MRFTEIDLFGVYVAPVALWMVAAWAALVLLRWLAFRLGLRLPVWHPALFTGAIYTILLSAGVILAGL